MRDLSKPSALLRAGTVLCCVCLSLPGLAQSRTAKTGAVNANPPGIVLFSNSINVGGASVSLSGVRISLRTHRLEIGIPEKGQDGDTLLGFQARYEAAAVLSGGFLKSFYPPAPLGLMKHNDVLLNRGVKSDLLTGMLVASKFSAMITPYADDQCTSAWSECLESGPLLVVGGRAALPSPDQVHLKSTRLAIDGRFQRAFIALLPGGEAVLGITGEITLSDLQGFLVRPADRGGLGCTSALNLSGGGSAGLLTQIAAKTTSIGTVDIFLPNSIVIH